MPAPGDKRIRIILTVPQMQAILSAVEAMISDGDTTVEFVEVSAAFKVKLLEEELGLVKPLSVVAAPKPALIDKLGMREAKPTVQTIPVPQTPEEIQAFFDKEIIKIHAASQEAKKRMEAGEILPDPFIDPEFDFKKD